MRWNSLEEEKLVSMLSSFLVERGSDNTACLICKSIDQAGPINKVPIHYIFKNIVKELDRLSSENLTERPNVFKTPCKHERITRVDGLDECLDCGAKNY